MVSPVSPTVANLYMEVESRALITFTQIACPCCLLSACEGWLLTPSTCVSLSEVTRGSRLQKQPDLRHLDPVLRKI